MATPADREFALRRRGFIRDQVILASFRYALRSKINPETGNLFTDDEIARATAPGTRRYIEADAVDQLGQLDQRRALWLADQFRIERASTWWIDNVHAPLWAPEGRLKATGGAGDVEIKGTPGTIVIGSTTVPNPLAYKARDGAGKEFQVFQGGTIDGTGVIVLTLAAVDGGKATNLKAGDTLTWTFRDPAMQPTATVQSDFAGGTDAETDAEIVSRMLGNIRHRPASGNDAHFRGWGRRASNAIEDCFVYPCAQGAGSVLAAATQKRAGVAGPLARIPTPAVLSAFTSYLVPPNSPVVPSRPRIVPTPVNAQYTDLSLRISLTRGTPAGWFDRNPFPSYHVTAPAIVSVAGEQDFTIQCLGDATLPGQSGPTILLGANAPQIMVWDKAKSTWRRPAIQSVQDLGGNLYRIVLTAPIGDGYTPTVGDVVSPYFQRNALVANALVSYFDELGPGNLFDIDNDQRGDRCQRFPRVNEERPFRAGAVAAVRAIEALGGTASDATLPYISRTDPSYPANLTLGPNMLVMGNVGVYLL